LFSSLLVSIRRPSTVRCTRSWPPRGKNDNSGLLEVRDYCRGCARVLLLQGCIG
jgi:hypothetical protein